MAKIETKKIIVTFNKLVKNGEKAQFDLPKELTSTIEAVAQEMVDSNVIVEVEISHE